MSDLTHRDLDAIRRLLDCIRGVSVGLAKTAPPHRPRAFIVLADNCHLRLDDVLTGIARRFDALPTALPVADQDREAGDG